jgi:hypothetical protein
MILTIITPSMSHSWYMSHNWYIMNHSWWRLRLELTIILNLEDQIRSIKMDQKAWMDTLHVFNPFLGGKTKSQLGRCIGTISRTLWSIESIANMDNPKEWPRRNQDGWNSSDCCSEFDNRRFEDHSGQRILSIFQLVGKGTSRHMIPTTSLSNNIRERKLWDEV